MSEWVISRELLDQVAALSREAGVRILEVYGTDFEVQKKDDESPLTAADLAANQTIIEGLSRLTPGVPVLSEESSETPYSERATWRRYWLVDPLDGTKEFIKRNGEFTVNIALIEDETPVLGVVYVPVKNITYLAARGIGAYKQSDDGDIARISARPRPNDGPTMVVGSRSHSNAQTEAFISRLGDAEVVSIGSSLKCCLVADGSADVYPRFGPTSEWDIAAAQCVVEQAGGHLTDMNLKPISYNTKDSYLNPHFLVYGDESVNWAAYIAA